MLAYYDGEIGAARAARLRGSPYEGWSPADRAAVEDAARKMRGGYLGPILALDRIGTSAYSRSRSCLESDLSA